MKELYRTSDVVKMSMIRHALADEGIECFELDRHTGNLYAGLAGMAPRLMVIDDDYERAVQIVREMGLDE